LVSDDVLAPTFLKYFLLSDKFIDLVSGTTYGAKMPRANWDAIGSFPILLPSLLEQKQIVAFLDHKTSQLDALIAMKKDLIEKLKEQRRAMITQDVTRGLNPNVPMQDSLVGEIPEHWEVRRLKFFAERVFTGSTPPSEDNYYYDDPTINWFTPSDFTAEGVVLKDSNRKLSAHAVENGVARYFNQSSVLIVGIGATLGRVGIASPPFACNQQINVVIPLDTLIPEFLFYSLSVREEEMKVISNATTLGIMNQEKTKQIEICAPDPEEQRRIVEVLNSETRRIDDLVSKIELAVDRLTEYRIALITAATTGKIDVRNVKLKAK